MTRSLRVLPIVCLAATAGLGQIIGKAPARFQFDGDVAEWDRSAALSFGDERTFDSIWVAQGAGGLIVAGMVRGELASLARNREDLADKGRIEIWLSETDEIALPPLNFAGEKSMEPDDCDWFDAWFHDRRSERCRQWSLEQPAYREKLPGLFKRMWRVTAWCEIVAMVSSFGISVLLLILARNGIAMGGPMQLLTTVIATTICWVAAAYLGPQTDMATLIAFYKKVQPGGPGWAYVREKAGITEHAADAITASFPLSLLGWSMGCLTIWSALFSVGNLLYGRMGYAAGLLAVFVVSGGLLVRVVGKLWK